MDPLRKLFTGNLKPKQRQYEALRMIAIDGSSYEDAANKFGYSAQSVRNLKTLALSGRLEFFPDVSFGPRDSRTPPERVARVFELRRTGQSIYEICEALKMAELPLPISTIASILSKAAIPKLDRRTDYERGFSKKNLLVSDRAENLKFDDLEPFKIDCPVVGVFLLIPYIIESGIVDIVKKCVLPDSSDIGAGQAALAMLLLKLIGSERLSHIQSYDQEPGFGIFAALNNLPKPSYMCTYSCRTTETMLEVLQKDFVSHCRRQFPDFYQSKFINLDFHSIPHFGDESHMEKVWCGARHKSMKGANTMLAQDGQSNVIIYTKADVLRKNEAQEIKGFVNYWKTIKGAVDETLVFDCKLTSYTVLGELNASDPIVSFITLRKRNATLLEETRQIPDDKWQKMHLPIPKRKNQRFLVYDTEVLLKGCAKPFRQIIVKDHGRVNPTFIITNNRNLDLQQVLEVYARRWHIENKINELVSFFNLNALSSPLMIRIHFDIFWTTVADTIYHRFAMDLPRYEKTRAPTLFKRFINFPGRIEYNGQSFKVKIRKRAHTPILLGVKKLTQPISVPWLNNKRLHIVWTA